MPRPERRGRARPANLSAAKKRTVATAAEAAPVQSAKRPEAAAGDYRQAAFEAMARSGALLAEGLEGIGQAWIGVAQATMHDGAATARAIIAAKSPRQVLELQANYARVTIDRLVAESGKLPALSVGVANRSRVRSRPRSSACGATRREGGRPLSRWRLQY
jgi:hypothetical protein